MRIVTIEPQKRANAPEALDLHLVSKGKDPMDTLATLALLVILAPIVFLGLAVTISFIVEDSVRSEIGQ
ncbi:hypothetical protein DLM45_02370 [Hyphomicrobium methylovorum]|uniref:hypothetical protein n=1 Tax=Hyphomicrobium methylovorum TaxID=84 RepID=UPI0015E79F81|nr:hypothetical protein [Hyphomicrobium methylovorum]MBA2125071.1 hypothetical protein [Hyphomicrobium methylovorum]